MLIGAHVSPAGGPAKAVERGVERRCRAIQIFNQNPRAWKPRDYSETEVAEYHAAMSGSGVDALVIHAVYLINCASEDDEILAKSLASLIASLRAGRRLGAGGVILHPGSALKNGGSVEAAIKRTASALSEALAESESCRLLLENTAGAGGTLGRSFEELATLIELAGGDERLGVCLDSAHLLASGYDVRSVAGLAEVLDSFDEIVGLDRLRALHVNDSQAPLGANRDRHAALGDGEIGRAGCAAFLSEPRFDGLPCIFEGPGVGGSQVQKEDIEMAMALREEGLAARASQVRRS
jgi:deoxyribonuclease-4